MKLPAPAGVVAALLMTLTLLTTPVYGQPRAAAGRVKLASGSVFIVRDGAAAPVQAGQIVYEADTLRTGADGRIGVTLNDDTRVSLGPSSEVRLDQFAYAPAHGQFALVIKVVRGLAAYVSGRIAKLAPDAIRLETPSAIVGVRGTTVALRATL